MRILDNCQRVLASLSVRATVVLLLVAAVMLPRVQAQQEGLRPNGKKPPAGVEDAGPAKQADGWGPERDGLRTRLVPAQKEYVLGQPAKFRLEMKNFGTRKHTYDNQGTDYNDSVLITGRDGKALRYVAGVYQTSGGAKPIAPGEAVFLFDKLDLTGQYLFVEPGPYTLQFRGGPGFGGWGPFEATNEIPPSGTIAVQIRPGKLPQSTQVPARLLDRLPPGWEFFLNRRVSEVSDGKIAPPGWQSGPGTYVCLIHNYSMDPPEGQAVVYIWVAERRLAHAGSVLVGGAAKPGDSAVYLGKSPDGHVYFMVSKMGEKKWPDVRAKVKAALMIEK